MPKHDASSPLEQTLVYFLDGIPVIFVEIEDALGSSPHRSREVLYRNFSITRFRYAKMASQQ